MRENVGGQLVAAGLLVLCLGCESDVAPPESQIAYSVAAEELKVEDFYAHDSLAAPTFLAPLDDVLLVLNPYAEPHLHLVDATTGELTAAVGRSGEGPREFSWPSSVSWNLHDDEVWFADPNQGRIAGFIRDSLLSGTLVSTRLVRVEGATFRTILRQPDDTFVADDVSGTGTFVRFSDDGDVLSRLGPPPPVLEEVPVEVRGWAFSNTIAQHPVDGRLVTGGVWTGELVIYAPDGTEPDTADAPVRFEPRFSVGTSRPEPSMIPDEDGRQGYLSIATTPGHILGLFSGRRFGDSRQDQGGWDVHVFDWDGQLKSIYRLPFPVVAITYDATTGQLFASRLGVMPSVVRAVLPVNLD